MATGIWRGLTTASAAKVSPALLAAPQALGVQAAQRVQPLPFGQPGQPDLEAPQALGVQAAQQVQPLPFGQPGQPDLEVPAVLHSL
jgi:hypothetical protein